MVQITSWGYETCEMFLMKLEQDNLQAITVFYRIVSGSSILQRKINYMQSMRNALRININISYHSRYRSGTENRFRKILLQSHMVGCNIPMGNMGPRKNRETNNHSGKQSNCVCRSIKNVSIIVWILLE